MRWCARLTVSLATMAFSTPGAPDCQAAEAARLDLAWADNLLTIRQRELPGGKLVVNYLEAFCRSGSSDRDWSGTVIPHTTRLVSEADDRHELALESRLRDGVIVKHKILAGTDEVSFELSAHNPTTTASEVHWVQPCIRVDQFTGRNQHNYLPFCFVLIDGKVTRLPTRPWATKGRYTPGQVYRPEHVDRSDVNPRPLSSLVPSHGLIGAFSGDGRWIVASAWEPYQELFQGVLVCVHSDLRIGGLEPGQTKPIHGKIYLARDSIDELVKRYERDFPEHLLRKQKKET